MSLFYTEFSNNCKIFLSELSNSFNRDTINKIATLSNFSKRKKVWSWLFILALLSTLSNHDHALSQKAIDEKYCSLAEKHNLKEVIISWVNILKNF